MRLVHKTIQDFHTGRPVNPNVLDTILEDGRLLTQKSWIGQRVLDLILTIITFQPSLMTDERMTKFSEFWKQMSNSTPINVLFPRNLILFSQSRDKEETWKKLSCVTKHLIHEKLITLEGLQEDCLTLLRQDWPADLSRSVSEFLKNVLSSVSDSSQETQVVDWIAWFCSDKDDEEF